MAKEQFEFLKKDRDILKGIAWTTDGKPSANVIIITGMAEKAERYDNFATFLNKNGLNVYCLDHFGQGLNAEDEKQLGISEKSGFRKTVFANLDLVRKLKITCLPIYILGHSMGSFMLQDFIQRFGREIDKVILSGTNGPSAKTKFGGMIIRHITRIKGRSYRSKYVHNLVFKGYNKQFHPCRTEFDWLSRNKDVVDAYIADPYCGFMPTVGFYNEFVKGINRLNKKSFLQKIPHHLPILLIAGSNDPVGRNGRGVRKLEKNYRRLSLNVKTNIYDGMRHEVLNEIGNDVVYNDVLNFLLAKN